MTSFMQVPREEYPPEKSLEWRCRSSRNAVGEFTLPENGCLLRSSALRCDRAGYAYLQAGSAGIVTVIMK